jgi:oligopeptide/dipeptide ABC transporter ATP-binding protein
MAEPDVLTQPVLRPTADSADGDVLLRVEDLKVYFPIRTGLVVSRHVGDVRAVDGVSFTVKRGETLGLVGESGCGKSTTGRAIIRLYDPTAGRIVFDGTDIAGYRGSDLTRMRRRMQMVFQDPYSSLDPRQTAGGTISEPLEIHGVGNPKERRERVRELLSTVGLNPDDGDRYPHEFSGGQRQRIGVARALALEPDLIVADEPISALDVSIQAQIINLLERLQSRLQLTYLFIAHDLSVVRHISDRIAVMYLGRIVEVAPSRQLNQSPLHPYTVALLSAIPVPDPKVEAKRRRIILKGDVPSPVDPPSGCRFHTRCWLRERLGNPERCVAEDPILRPLETGHEVACHFAEEIQSGRAAATVAAVTPPVADESPMTIAATAAMPTPAPPETPPPA